MDRLEEALAKEKQRNYAAKFVLSFLGTDQVEALDAQLEPLSKENLEEARNAFIETNSFLRLTVGGMSPDEVNRALTLVREAVPELYKQKAEDHERAHAGAKYLRARRDAFWPVLLRNLQKAEKQTDDGNWVEVKLADVRGYVESVSDNARAFLVSSFFDAFDKDMEERAKYPGSFRPGV